jgi:hypothetical protein
MEASLLPKTTAFAKPSKIFSGTGIFRLIRGYDFASARKSGATGPGSGNIERRFQM